MFAQLRTWYVSLGLLLVGILLVNVGFLNWYVWSESRVTDKEPVSVIVEKTVEVPSEEQVGATKIVSEKVVDDCDKECIKKLIAESVASLSSVVKEEPVVTSASKASTVVSEERTELVALAGGSGSGNDWTRVGEVKWLDTSLYGSLVSATWEGWVDVPGGSGTVEARLYDATNGREVDGSKISVVNVERTSFYSSNISLWRGQNQYYVEIKNTAGGTVSLSGLQIRMIVR